jgi:hypothetical protein
LTRGLSLAFSVMEGDLARPSGFVMGFTHHVAPAAVASGHGISGDCGRRFCNGHASPRRDVQ